MALNLLLDCTYLVDDLLGLLFWFDCFANFAMLLFSLRVFAFTCGYLVLLGLWLFLAFRLSFEMLFVWFVGVLSPVLLVCFVC